MPVLLLLPRPLPSLLRAPLRQIRSVSCLGATHIPRRWDESGRPYEATADDAAYATFELYWDSRYHAISRSAYRIGSRYVISHPVTVDLSAVRQDNRFGSPRAVDAIWLRLDLYY